MTDLPEDPDRRVIRLDAVRARLEAAEPVDMDGVPEAGDASGEDSGGGARDAPWGDAGPPPEDEEETPPAARCVALPLNDLGNARRLVVHYGEDLLFVPRVGWFLWTGKVWAKDPDQMAVLRRAQELGRLIEEEIPHVAPFRGERAVYDRASRVEADLRALDARPLAELSEEERERHRDLTASARAIGEIRARLAARRKDLRSHARASGNHAKIEAALKQAQPLLAQPLEALDADPYMINCESGALRALVEKVDGVSYATIRLEPHDREQHLTKMMPVEWREAPDDGSDLCPTFTAFLARIQPDPAMRGFLQRWFGLSLTGLAREQKFVFLHGGGNNGKSVLVDLVARILGDYAATAKIESLVGQNRRSGGDATPDLVPLIGARMVRASEPKQGEPLEEGRVKELTGGEPILIRALNQDFVEVRPVFKLTVSGNHKPEIRGNDHGIWRRVLLVPFLVTIPPEEIDQALPEKLWAERSGILRWMVDGLLAYLEGGLREPQAVVEATAAYRSDSDPLGTFLMQACVVSGDPRDTIRAAELTEAFNFWLEEAGKSPWKPTTIQRQLGAMARIWKHPVTGVSIEKGKSSLSQYEGLRLGDLFRDRFDKAPRDASGRRKPTGREEGEGW